MLLKNGNIFFIMIKNILPSLLYSNQKNIIVPDHPPCNIHPQNQPYSPILTPPPLFPLLHKIIPPPPLKKYFSLLQKKLILLPPLYYSKKAHRTRSYPIILPKRPHRTRPYPPLYYQKKFIVLLFCISISKCQTLGNFFCSV